jgi:hypothetical protein
MGLVIAKEFGDVAHTTANIRPKNKLEKVELLVVRGADSACAPE